MSRFGVVVGGRWDFKWEWGGWLVCSWVSWVVSRVFFL